jgi:GNAT superfamily N-acetyltransferase
LDLEINSAYDQNRRGWRYAKPLTTKVERVIQLSKEIAEYLQANLLANALDLWNLQHEPNNFELFVGRDQGRITGHLSIFRSPEAYYTSLASDAPDGAGPLLDLVPEKCVLIVEPGLYNSIKSIIQPHLAYPNDRMIVAKGHEILMNSDSAVRLLVEDASEYVRFGASFNSPQLPLEWARERLERDIVFGVFSDASLASVASLVARLPSMAVIMSVETLQEFRGMGYASVVSSAATKEALKYSESCALFVRSDNSAAIHIYEKLGYRKIGDELWIDVGTGLIP